MIDHKELRRLALSATPGPWKWDDKGFGILQQTNGKSWEYVLDPVNEAGNTGYMQGKDDDKAYIAALSPSVVLALLDEVEAMRSALTLNEDDDAVFYNDCAVVKTDRYWQLREAEESAEALRKDAERYRWIKSSDWSSIEEVWWFDERDLDSGIDAAMQAKEEGK